MIRKTLKTRGGLKKTNLVPKKLVIGKTFYSPSLTQPLPQNDEQQHSSLSEKNNAQKLPSKTQKLPSKTQKLPLNIQKLPLNIQKLPLNIQKLSPQTVDVLSSISPGSHDSSLISSHSSTASTNKNVKIKYCDVYSNANYEDEQQEQKCKEFYKNLPTNAKLQRYFKEMQSPNKVSDECINFFFKTYLVFKLNNITVQYPSMVLKPISLSESMIMEWYSDVTTRNQIYENMYRNMLIQEKRDFPTFDKKYYYFPFNVDDYGSLLIFCANHTKALSNHIVFRIFNVSIPFLGIITLCKICVLFLIFQREMSKSCSIAIKEGGVDLEVHDLNLLETINKDVVILNLILQGLNDNDGLINFHKIKDNSFVPLINVIHEFTSNQET